MSLKIAFQQADETVENAFEKAMSSTQSLPRDERIRVQSSLRSIYFSYLGVPVSAEVIQSSFQSGVRNGRDLNTKVGEQSNGQPKQSSPA